MIDSDLSRSRGCAATQWEITPLPSPTAGLLLRAYMYTAGSCFISDPKCQLRPAAAPLDMSTPGARELALFFSQLAGHARTAEQEWLLDLSIAEEKMQRRRPSVQQLRDPGHLLPWLRAQTRLEGPRRQGEGRGRQAAASHQETAVHGQPRPHAADLRIHVIDVGIVNRRRGHDTASRRLWVPAVFTHAVRLLLFPVAACPRRR